MTRPLTIILTILLAANGIAYAHGGGLDKSGGHHNRKTGEYHCHKSPCAEKQKSDSSTKKKYARALFPHWIDEDGDCQNARIEVLIRDAIFIKNEACRSVEGAWIDKYTGRTLSDTGNIDIDHIVPLKEAWDSGAQAWSDEKMIAFANDLDNLVPVSRSINRKKGAKDPARWMPNMNTCWYLERWQAIKTKYQLEYDTAEKAAIKTALAECS